MTEYPKIALIGYGSMGKEIEAVAIENNIIITDIFDIDKPLQIDAVYNFDVAIDFSMPTAVLDNTRILAYHKKNIVIGTTGWMENKENIFRIAIENNIGLLYGSNFSIGIQIFNKLVAQAASLISEINDYDIMLHELHHKRKKDSPSGTALAIAQIILKNNSRKTKILSDTSYEKIDPANLHVTSTRGGEIAGTHTVYLDSSADTIEITHRAKNRRGFAIGAISAAKWIFNKQGIYNFDDIL